MKELKGIITAMVTPFDETEKMDITAAKKMARWLVDNGVHGYSFAELMVNSICFPMTKKLS